MRDNPKNINQPSEVTAETGGHLLTKLLQAKGVNFVFGTTGAGMPDIQDAMVIEKPPKWIQGLHEFVSVNAAVGYSLGLEDVGVALIDRLVGVQNSLGAIYGAYLNAAPTIILASENLPGVQISTGAPELHYSSNMFSLVSSWTKWSTRLNSLETIDKDLNVLFHHTKQEPCGPTFFSLPQNLMAQKLGKTSVSFSRDHSFSYRVPDDKTCKDIAESILTHEKPFVVTSHLGRHKDSVEKLKFFAHQLGIGILEKRFFMNYPSLDKLHNGFLHRYRETDISNHSDLALLLDIGLLPHQDLGKGLDTIELTGAEFGKNFVYAGGDYGQSLLDPLISCICDTGPALGKISKIAKSMIGASEEEEISARKSALEEQHDKLESKFDLMSSKSYERGELNAYSVGYVINKAWENDFIWVNGAATYFEHLLNTIKLSVPGTYFGNPSGHLGTTVGMAYGLALSSKKYENVNDHGSFKAGSITGPYSPVICTTGDGDAIFGNIDSALWTCKHYGIGVIYVILNNECWGAEIPPFEETHFRRAATAKDYEFFDIHNPSIDFVKLASAYNVKGERVENVTEMEAALTSAIRSAKSGNPFVIDVRLPKQSGKETSVVT